MICILTVFTRCNKCHSEEYGDKTFTQTELNIVPYIGSEKLTFKDSQGDSICYSGQGRTSEMNEKHDQDGLDDKGCSGNYRQVQSVNILFTSDNSDSAIHIKLFYDYPFGVTKNDTYMEIVFGSTDYYSHYTFWGEYSYDANNIMSPKSYGLQGISSVSAHYDTLTLINKTFYSVYELTVSAVNENTQKVYYSISKGIVGFKRKTGAIWYLD